MDHEREEIYIRFNQRIFCNLIKTLSSLIIYG